MDDQIVIIFGMNIPDTIGHQMTIYAFVAPNFCFCTTWGKQNKQNINFESMQYHYLIKITHIQHILSKFLALWLTAYPNVQLCNCWQSIFELSAICESTGREMHSRCVNSNVDNVLLQTSTSRFLSSLIFLNIVS